MLYSVAGSCSRRQGVEHVFTASDQRVLFFQSRLHKADVRTFLTEPFTPEEWKAITDYEGAVLTSVEWTLRSVGTNLGVSCAQCGNDVNEGGETL